VTARFENVGSLKDKAPVAMSGVTIGRVTKVEFDPASLDAMVTFVIDSQYDQIPDDSDASILTSGLLGSQYIGLQAGGSEFSLEEGSEIQFTQSAIVIENLISKYLFNKDKDSDSE
jgi:phospholipid/cholesterol/gamma-HCH transport system substrate-binding protein